MSKDNSLLPALTTNDLQGAGISAQLNSNDLIEVVAHDIYDKYVEAINDSIKQGDALHKESKELFNVELERMKAQLSIHLKGEKLQIVSEEEQEEDSFDGFSASYGKVDDYWPYLTLKTIKLVEKDRGTFVEDGHHHIHVPVLKARSAKVKLTIASGYITTNKEVKTGTIKGTVETTVKQTFEQVITVPMTRFKDFQKKLIEYNERLTELKAFLPKNGLLSVERFTREARVKMNKNIIRQQSTDFKEKISKLFSIEL